MLEIVLDILTVNTNIITTFTVAIITIIIITTLFYHNYTTLIIIFYFHYHHLCNCDFYSQMVLGVERVLKILKLETWLISSRRKMRG